MAANGEVPTLGDGVAFVFPGQGSQFVGMGAALVESSAAARRVFAQADDLLGFSLSRLCFAGPAAELDDTVNTQPAILTHSVAALEALRERLGPDGMLTPVAVAGHSLGEYSALVAAGSIAFSDALALVRERGRLMKAAGTERPGGMAAVIGLDDDRLAAICKDVADAGVVVVANANCPGQTVLSGAVPALERAMAVARERGARKVARLGISIASHSPLMEGAAAKLRQRLDATAFDAPRVPVVANVTGQTMTTVDAIREELAHQIERPVDWIASVRRMVDLGATTFVEVGPGKVLSGLVRRIDGNARTLGIADVGLPDGGRQ